MNKERIDPGELISRYNRRFPITGVQIPNVTGFVSSFFNRDRDLGARIEVKHKRRDKEISKWLAKLEAYESENVFAEQIQAAITIDSLLQGYQDGRVTQTITTDLTLKEIVDEIHKAVECPSEEVEWNWGLIERAKAENKPKICINPLDARCFIEVPLTDDGQDRQIRIIRHAEHMRSIADGTNIEQIKGILSKPENQLKIAESYCAASLKRKCETRSKLGPNTKITLAEINSLVAESGYPAAIFDGTLGLKGYLDARDLKKAKSRHITPLGWKKLKGFRVTFEIDGNELVTTRYLSKARARKIRNSISENFQKGEISSEDIFSQILFEQVSKEAKLLAMDSKKLANITLKGLLNQCYLNLGFPKKVASSLTESTVDVLQIRIFKTIYESLFASV